MWLDSTLSPPQAAMICSWCAPYLCCKRSNIIVGIVETGLRIVHGPFVQDVTVKAIYGIRYHSNLEPLFRSNIEAIGLGSFQKPKAATMSKCTLSGAIIR